MKEIMDGCYDNALCEDRQREAVKAGLLFGRLFSARLDEQARMDAEEDEYENAYDRFKEDEHFEQRMRGW